VRQIFRPSRHSSIGIVDFGRAAPSAPPPPGTVSLFGRGFAAASGRLNTGFVWGPLRIGGGGLINGIMIAPDGTKVCRCDSFGAYIRSAGQSNWRQLCTPSSLPASALALFSAAGVGECQIAPSNSQVLYLWYGQINSGNNAFVFVSTDQGTTWVQTTFSHSYSFIGNNRFFGPKGAVDPANPDVLFLMPDAGGLYFTTNGTSGGSSTFTQVSTSQVPVNTSSGVVVFDPSSGTTGGQTNRIYCASAGNGLYAQLTPGGGFALVTNSFTNILRGCCSSDGVGYFVNNQATLIKVTWSGSTPTVTNITPAGLTVQVAVPDPNNLGTVIALSGSGSGGYAVSTNYGASWSAINTSAHYTYDTTVAPYLNSSSTFPGNLEINDAQADPSVNPSTIYFSGWQAVWSTALPLAASGSHQLMTADCLGIEQLAADAIVCVPGHGVLCCAQDWCLLQVTNPGIDPNGTPPSTQNWDQTYQLNAAWHADYCPGTPTFQVVVAGYENAPYGQDCAYSTNGGSTWTKFSAQPANAAAGGSIACDATSTSNILIAQSGSSGKLYYTTNQGSTWTAPAGLPTSGWGFSSYPAPRRICCADRVNSGTFYAWNYSNGMYVTTNSFSSWTNYNNYGGSSSPSTMDTSQAYAHLKSVPGQAGNLFFSCFGGGPGSPSSFPNTNYRFWRSTNGGQTWSMLGSGTSQGSIAEVLCFGFGAAQPGQTYPAIYFIGYMYLSGAWTPGTYASYDNASTWTTIGGFYPDGFTDLAMDLDGDMNNFGVVYIAKDGSSFGTRQPV
jgi:xyloglucan-specific exo-beta-1,4-glucanase